MHQGNLVNMKRRSITFTMPNDEWLREMVENQKYSSKCELVNDLVRQARNQQIQIDWMNKKMEDAEKSGFTQMTQSEIHKESKSNINGGL